MDVKIWKYIDMIYQDLAKEVRKNEIKLDLIKVDVFGKGSNENKNWMKRNSSKNWHYFNNSDTEKKKLGIFYHLISSDKNKEYEMNEVVIVIIISFEADHRKYKGKF